MRTRLGHYDIVAELGRGGMGVVYKGFESSLNRYVAIKVLADSLAHDEAIRERFLREARSMAALNDPHIIQIYFIGEDEGQPYFVMEFVEGESLGSMLKRDHRLTVEQAVKVIHQTAQGLATAHDAGVIHRDIKPGNLMISSRGAVKIADFGIALSNQDLSKKLTTTGEFVGTPGYLSPEVCLGKPVDQRSDIFSLGIVLYEMLTGRMPFNDESPLGLMLEVVRAEIPDVRTLNDSVDSDVARILARMIAKDPADRYPSCHELVVDLQSHPLVAKGGPITVQTKLSAAAATVIGQKTPAAAQVSLPVTPPLSGATPSTANTRITPMTSAAPPLGPAEASAHRPVLRRGGERRGSGPWPWAIAAALVLALGATAWAWRAELPGFTEAPAGALAQVPVEAAGAPPVAAATPAAIPTAEATAETALSVDPTNVVETSPASSPDSDAQAGEGPAARAAQADLEALRELPAAQAAAHAAAEGQQVAIASPPPKPAAPSKPRVPTIAIVLGGDDVIASPAGEALLDLLQQRGFRVIEAGAAGGAGPDLQRLAGKADAVLFVNARPVGTQDMQYYGQVSTLYTVQLAVKAYRVSDRSVLWSSPTQQVNFTSLNAADQAYSAVEPMLDQVDRRLDEFRLRSGRRG